MTKKFLLKCKDCGTEFFTEGEKYFYLSKGLIIPKRCKLCRDKRKQELQIIKDEQSRCRIKKESCFQVYELSDLCVNASKTLYIIGNGFDLAHDVNSSYSAFRSTIGKTSELGWALDLCFNVHDLWCDFERELANINPDIMYGSIEKYLAAYDAYNADGQMADFYAAIDAAAYPINILARDLPKSFCKWIKSLRLPENVVKIDRLIIPGAYYLNFNYTEFLEVLYGATDVCYIHGDRRKKEKLIFGHSYDVEVNDGNIFPPRYKDAGKHRFVEYAFEEATEHLIWYDNEVKKNSKEIIKERESFFNSLECVDRVIVIGHSLSLVDWDYFRVIKNKICSKAKWIFSVHSEDNYLAAQNFVSSFAIEKDSVGIFIM